MTIGERIKNRRIELGMSQDEVAKKCGYKSRSSVQKIEASRDLPSRKISLMAKALECSESYLMGWKEAPEFTTETGDVIELFSQCSDEQKKRVLAYIEGILGK